MMDHPVIVGTGLSSALGRALVERIAPAWQVVALGRTPLEGPGMTWLSMDFRDSPEVWKPAMTTWLEREKPRVAAFVHGAGLVYSDHTEATTADEWTSMLGVNLTAAFVLGKLLSPYFVEGARVVLVGSVDARYASSAGPAAGYGAAKAGLYGLVRHWAAEWGARSIRVNGVAPGALEEGSGPQSDSVRAALEPRIALRRMGRADEVASVIAFLLSDESSYMTGCWIPVDGGLNLTY